MGRREIKEITRQNKEKKTISPIIVCLAFLLGMAMAAFAAFWRTRASKDKKGAGTSGRESAGDSARTERKALPGQQRSESVSSAQTQKVKPYRPRKRASVKRIFGRMTAVVAAAALVVTGLYLTPSDRMPASTVQAKERQSLGGIKQVVEEHNRENPFVILDIVPGKAVSQDGKYEFSLGTIGYLAPGQSPIQQDIFRMFTGEGKEKLYPYSARMDLIESILGSGMTGVTYREAYGGTEENLEKNGWTRVFDPVAPDADGKLPADGYPTGELYAHEALMSGGGYDLVWEKLPGLFSSHTTSAFSAGNIYTFAGNEGNYRVTFGGPGTAVSGYLPVELASGSIAELKEQGYSDATGLYCLGTDGFI
ncbi:MAG: hypothetical protein K2M22_00935, partial [Lachnospiraceae bacterium]|nr:hypothetical protein [Lachnospiraceae bacterium]